MVESQPNLVPRTRKPRLLWANVYCLMDTSSGASMAVREMLLQLAKAGFEIEILSATVFDHERGTAGLQGHWGQLKKRFGQFVQLVDGPLRHTVQVTASINRGRMTSTEESHWFDQYVKKLDVFKPDIVYYYGGKPLDFLIPIEAKQHGISTAFYLANGNYTKTRWCRDVDLILTDSHATSEMYKQRLGIDVTPVGAFIDPMRVVADQHSRERILFINPALEKGAALVARLALLLEQRRPDIMFEVVESRGSWRDVLHSVSAAAGQPRESLSNVVVTPHTSDMRPLYGRARLLLAPSLCWESAGRVLAEAMLNGIPAIITDRGGMPEMVGDACIKLKLPEFCYQKPWNKLPSDDALTSIVQRIEALYDDGAMYQDLVAQAKKIGHDRHGLAVNTRRLQQALQPLIAPRPDECLPDVSGVALNDGKQAAIEGVRTIVLLSSWSTGSTAVAGYIERLGAYSCPPHQKTTDVRTPDSHEPKVLRDKLAACVDELTLKLKIQDRGSFREWFAHWLAGEKQKAASQGLEAIVLKHPLLAFFVEEVESVCHPVYIVVTRQFDKIEATRQRRKWHPIYGTNGASVIYNRIYNELTRLGLSALSLGFEGFKSESRQRQRLIEFIAMTPDAQRFADAETWVF